MLAVELLDVHGNRPGLFPERFFVHLQDFGVIPHLLIRQSLLVLDAQTHASQLFVRVLLHPFFGQVCNDAVIAFFLAVQTDQLEIQRLSFQL